MSSIGIGIMFFDEDEEWTDSLYSEIEMDQDTPMRKRPLNAISLRTLFLIIL